MSNPWRRAVVLLAVLVVIAAGALVGTAVIYTADAERTAVEGTLRRAQARAMAWSGVRAVMAELAAQREVLLSGGAPTVTDEWDAGRGEQETGPGLGFRIVPVSGAPLVSEMGKIDLNTAGAEMLAALDGVGEDLAGRIVAAREARPFQSVLDLLDVEGVSSTMLLGDSDWDGDAEDRVGSNSGALGAESAQAPRLVDDVTVFSFDPELQAGVAEGEAGSLGSARFNLNAGAREGLEDVLAAVVGAQVAANILATMQPDTVLKDRAELFGALRRAALEPGLCGAALDVLTTDDGAYRFGLVDLNTASERVLAAVPGIGPGAAEIVARRGDLDAAQRASVAWPLAEGILTADQFAAAVNHLTVRCLQWRVVVEGGVFDDAGDGERASRRDGWEGGEEGARWGAAERGAMRDKVVLEAVIDVAGERPRLAYLRDITLLPLARTLAMGAGVGRGEEALDPTVNDAANADAAEAADEADPAAEPDSEPADERETDDADGRSLIEHGGGPEPGSEAGEPAEEPGDEPEGGAPSDDQGQSSGSRIGRWTPGKGAAR